MPTESSYEEELRRTQQYHFTQQRVQSYASTATPELAAGVVDYAQQHPYIDGKTAYALAAAGHAPDSPVAQAVAIKKLNKKGGGFWSGGPGAVVGRVGRGLIRNSLAGLETPFQFVTAIGRDVASAGALGRVGAGAASGATVGAGIGGLAGGVTTGVLAPVTATAGAVVGGLIGGVGGLFAGDVKGKANNPFLQTTAGQMIAGQGLGGGYVPRGPAHEAMVKQQQDAASIHGHALTGGRLLADAVFKPGSREYNFASGVIDATLIIKGDPVIHGGAEIKALRQQSKLFVPSERLATPLQRAFGMIRSETNMVDPLKVATDAVAHPDVVKWAGAMAEEKDAFKIWNMTNRKIPIEAANAIAAEPEAAGVLDIVKNGIQSGDIAEKAAVREGKGIASTIRGYRQNSRLLAQMPGGGIDLKGMNVKHSGKLEKAVARFDDWMKNAGYSEELRSSQANKLMQVKNGTEAQAVVQKTILEDFQGMLLDPGEGRRLTGRGGITDELKAPTKRSPEGQRWGWDKKKVDSILGEYAKIRDDMMGKLHDELSMPLGDSPNVAVLDRRLMPLAKADTVSELIENVIPLPNIREVRRIMNPSESLAKVYSSDTWKGSIALADKFMTQLWRPLVLIRPAFTIRMLGEETARMIANGMDAPLMHPFSLISSMMTPSERAVEAVGVTGDSHALSHHNAEAMIDLEALNHDAGILSKHTEIYKTTTPEGAQAWAGKLLNMHNDDLSRHLVDNGVDSAKEWWWSGEGKALREDYTARTGRGFTREASDAQVDKQMQWIKDVTGEHPALMHSISTGMIATELDAVEGAGIKWVSATAPDEAGRATIEETRTQLAEVKKKLAGDNASLQDDLDYFLSHSADQPDAPQSFQKYRANLRKEQKALEKKIRDTGAQEGHWDQELDEPLYFHGTQHMDDAGTLRSVQITRDRNLVGPGFSTTTDPEVASTYASSKVEEIRQQLDYREAAPLSSPAHDEHLIEQLKADLAAEEAKNAAVHRMTWRDPQNPPKLIDLEKPLPIAVRRVYEQAVEDALETAKVRPRNAKGHFIKQTDPDKVRLARESKGELENALKDLQGMGSEVRGYEVVQRAMKVLNDADKAEVLRVLQEAGHDGLSHAGGAVTGDVPHKVSVFFDPHKLGPANRVVPKNTSYVPKAGERGIQIKRTDGRGIINDEAKNHLLKLALDPTVKTPAEMTGAKLMTQQYQGRLGQAVKYMFEHLMSMPSNELIRNPAFNQAYWNKIIDTMPLMTAEAKQAALASLEHENVRVSSRVINQMHRAAKGSEARAVFTEAEVAAGVRNTKLAESEIREAMTLSTAEVDARFTAAADRYDALKAEGRAVGDAEMQKAYDTSQLYQRVGERMGAGNWGHGVVKLEDADMLAKGHALDFVSKTFEDLTGRNAIDEAVRHIAPFARAWRESSKKWVRTLLEDPTAARKLHRVLTAGGLGGEGKEGQGFFYKDEHDQWAFNYPASGLIGKIVSGTPFPMMGNVAAATPSLGGATSGGMGHALIPGAGPFVSIAASKLLPDTPTFDEAKSWLAPYGDPSATGYLDSITPPWMKSFQKSFESPDMAGMHANTVMETARYLMSTGDYDTSTQEGADKLLEDARKAGKHITMLRGLAQLFSPSSPKLTPMAQDKDGHTVVARLLTEDMHAMQEKDFNGATEAFLGKYGDQGMLYLQNNTRAVNPGSVDTDKGFDFLRNNADLVHALPLTAGLFAPPDGEFEYAAYLRGIQNGNRQQLTPTQMVALANDKVGSMLFYNTRDKLGDAATTEEGRAALGEVKSLLMKKYPGFNTVIGGLVEKAKTPQVIAELEKAVGMSKVTDTPVGKATAQYLSLRKKLNEIAEGRGLKTFVQSEKTADLRVAARTIGQALIKETPGFALVYDRIFDGEMKE